MIFLMFQSALGNLDIPYVQCHGDCDPVVPYKWGQMTASLVKQFLKNAEFKTYRGMMHGSSDEVGLLPRFLALTKKNKTKNFIAILDI